MPEPLSAPLTCVTRRTVRITRTRPGRISQEHKERERWTPPPPMTCLAATC